MLNPDYKDMLAALSDEGAEFLVVGAYAVISHGALRSTFDLDIFVHPTIENARRVWRALKRFGAPLRDVAVEDFTQQDLVYQIGVIPNRIDVITAISGVSFEEAWPNRVQVVVEGQNIPVIGRQELLKNKRACGRPKDLADVDSLERLAALASKEPDGKSLRRPARRRRR